MQDMIQVPILMLFTAQNVRGEFNDTNKKKGNINTSKRVGYANAVTKYQPPRSEDVDALNA